MLSPLTLTLKTLFHYWRTSLALLLAVAVGVAVLTGSILLGASVRASLRTLALDRLGRVEHALVSDQFFREGLAAEIPGACPLVSASGSVAQAESGARAGRVQILAVPDNFWSLENNASQDISISWKSISKPGEDSENAILNEPLARKLQARPGDEILLRLNQPSAVPHETLLGKRDQTVATLRLRVARIIPAHGLGRFTLIPSQFEPFNIYVPLATLQRRLKEPGRVNAILAPATPRAPNEYLTHKLDFEDLGLRLRPHPGYFSLETTRIFIPPYLAETALRCAAEKHLTARPTLTYLANSLASGPRSIPYSMVAALDDLPLKDGEIALNAWAANDLQAHPGDKLALTYYVSAPMGGLAESSTTLTLARVVPMNAPLADRNLTPDFPGIADAEKVAQWDPPFPLDLKRIRPADEDYWEKYRATPKAFVSLATGRRLWANRYGNLTALRLTGPNPDSIQQAMLNEISPARAGLSFQPVRAQALSASRGGSDFGGLFIGFSLFLLLSAAMLIRLLFLLSIEGRARQIGLLSAVGLPPRRIGRLLLAEGALVATVGGLAGTLGGILYAALLVHGLRTWWLGSIGTPFLSLAIDPASLAIGFVVGWLVALFSIWRAVRLLLRLPARALLAGRLSEDRASANASRKRRSLITGVIFALLSVALLAVAARQSAEAQAPLFFGVGASLLVAALAFFRAWLSSEPARSAERLTLTRLGLAAARRQSGRSLLVAALMASAVFVIVAAGANRQVARPSLDKASGTGGLTLMTETTIPLYQPLDPKLLNGATAYPFRLKPGDDASCLNLFQAQRPRFLGAPDSFIQRGGFTFAGSLAQTEAEKQNPWLLLRRPLADGAIPTIGDYNTVLWLLKSGLGKDFVVDGVRYRFVALLKGSIFQSELLIGSENFTRLFPNAGGWSFFVFDARQEKARPLAASLESAFEDNGLEATLTADRLNGLLAVENTYLSTFQSLGGLGLLLGTLGLALVLLRNLLERRAEFAFLRAVGFRYGLLVWLAMAENILLLLVGLAAGTLCALVAVAPSLLARSAEPPWLSLAATLAGVLVLGLLATALSAAITLRAPALKTLKEE